MGQYWVVTSPDQQQQLSTLGCGKLGVIFPGGKAGLLLEHLLMVPLHQQLVTPSKIFPDVKLTLKQKRFIWITSKLHKAIPKAL
jgi:hypothetical protein